MYFLPKVTEGIVPYQNYLFYFRGRALIGFHRPREGRDPTMENLSCEREDAWTENEI